MVTVIDSSAALRKKKILKKSLNFTMLVVGQSGCGRSTFINTLCDQLLVDASSTVNMYRPEEADVADRELHLRRSSVELEDNEGVKINLNVIDTPGFGDSIDNSVSFKIIKDYIKYQYDEILVEESRLKRNPRFKDGRIHVCLYFITASSHGLKEMDIIFMKELGEYVNIIPIISKSDSLTSEELKLNKKLIKEDIANYDLPIFDFNDEYFTYDESLDDETFELNKYLQKNIPFAVMGSNTIIKDSVTGESRRVRQYPWGTVDVFDNENSDFLTLKNTLLITHLNEFKDYTHEVLYEKYRTKTLANSKTRESISEPLEQDDSEEKLRAYEARVQRDLERKRAEIEARERELAELEQRLASTGI